jgi:hypothetical protein
VRCRPETSGGEDAVKGDRRRGTETCWALFARRDHVLLLRVRCSPHGSAGPEAGEAPDAFDDQVPQPVTSMRTILGDVGPNLRASLCRGEVVYGVGRFVGAGIKKDSAEEDRDGLCRAISSLGAILRGHQVHRVEGISGWSLTF